MAILAGLSLEWDVTGLAGIGVTAAGDDAITSDGKLCLEALEFSCKNNKTTNDIANWLADNCLSGDENEYFQEKIRSDLFVVSDDDFSYFVRNSTVVEPHVRIDDKTGTADGGALFYTENLPPESILCGIVLASVERGNKENKKDAETCLKKILWNENTGISGQLIQMGGDSTTGRGLVFVNAIKGE